MEYAQSAGEATSTALRTTDAPGRRTSLRKAAAASIIVAGFVLLSLMYAVSLKGKNPTKSDFVGYWVAGQQLAHHANPYDQAAILQLERSVGYDAQEARLTPSPPVAVLILLPLGYFSVKTALLLWTMAIFVCAAVSVRILWLLHGSPPTLLHLLGFLFAPLVACIQAGQLGVFFLAGIVLFLYFVQTRPFVAGIALLPCMMKPHLFVLFAIALMLWCVRQRSYRILVGAVTVLAVNCAAALFFDPHVWQHYARMMSESSLQDRYTPTLSVALRMMLAPNAEWPRFVFLALGCTWVLWYFWTHREHWNWMDHGLVVLMVSVMCSPYSWFTDESVLLPAVLTAAFRVRHSWRLLLPIGLAAGVALTEIARGVPITTQCYLWTTPAWLACYLYATVNNHTERVSTAEALLH